MTIALSQTLVAGGVSVEVDQEVAMGWNWWLSSPPTESQLLKNNSCAGMAAAQRTPSLYHGEACFFPLKELSTATALSLVVKALWTEEYSTTFLQHLLAATAAAAVATYSWCES